jgi:hypothetical protein
MRTERIENQRTGMRQHLVSMPNREQRADSATLSPLSCDFDRQFQQ